MVNTQFTASTGATRRSPRVPSQSPRQGPWDPRGRYGTAHAISRGQSSTSWSRNELALHANRRRDTLPGARVSPAAPGSLPAYAAFCRGAGSRVRRQREREAYPRADRNCPLRCESAAETTSWAPVRETRFWKSCAFAPNGVADRRRRSADLLLKRRARSVAFSRSRIFNARVSGNALGSSPKSPSSSGRRPA